MPVVFRDTVTTIKTFKGSHGAFVIANVQSELGEFVLKDAVMDQFIGQDGQYQGTFLVTKIFTHTRMWQGRIIVEQRIKISKMKLVKINEAVTPVDDLNVESDPLLETPVADSPVCVAAAPAPEAIVPTVPAAEETEADSVAVEAPDAPQATEPVAETVDVVDPPAAPQAVEAAAADSTADQEAGSDQDDGMAELFGPMWPNVQARQPVVITDWTDRAAIRRQREVLVGLGYVLDTATMTWSMPETETA